MRSHRRKEMGFKEEVQPKVEPDLLLSRRGSCSPSVGSVSSAGKIESAWAASPPNESSDQQPGLHRFNP